METKDFAAKLLKVAQRIEGRQTGGLRSSPSTQDGSASSPVTDVAKMDKAQLRALYIKPGQPVVHDYVNARNPP